MKRKVEDDGCMLNKRKKVSINRKRKLRDENEVEVLTKRMKLCQVAPPEELKVEFKVETCQAEQPLQQVEPYIDEDALYDWSEVETFVPRWVY